jgi:hypothetical protein
MKHVADVTGRIVPLDTEEGTRYALEVRGRIVSEEFVYMTQAAILAAEYGVEVQP